MGYLTDMALGSSHLLVSIWGVSGGMKAKRPSRGESAEDTPGRCYVNLPSGMDVGGIASCK